MKNILWEKGKFTEPFSVQFEGSFVSEKAMPQTLLKEVCILGRSNSGKSTLVSGLIREKKQVKISSRPGSTRTINFYNAGQFMLSDLPGYGYAKASQKDRDTLSEIISDYLQNRKQLTGGFLTSDARRDITSEETELAAAFRASRKPLFLIRTKADKLTQKEIAAADSDAEKYAKLFHAVVLVSAKDRIGLQPLFNYLKTIS